MIIVSMTTVPSRKKRLLENLESLLNQSYKFDKLVINVDDNLTDEDYEFYDGLTGFNGANGRIEVNKCDAKWRSCNKLLPTIKKYPEDVIITVDDDVHYPKDCIKELVEMHEKHPECVISHEINPIMIRDGKFVGYANTLDVKLLQVEYGKYLSNCCLFPAHTFDGLDGFNRLNGQGVFDYEKMMECTGGTHDELWFWVHSTIRGVPVIGLDYILTFHSDILTQWSDDEYRLANVNGSPDTIDNYNKKVIEMYGKEIDEVVGKHRVAFKLTKDNVYSFIMQFERVAAFYGYGFDLDVSELTSGYRNMVVNYVNRFTGRNGFNGSNEEK